MILTVAICTYNRSEFLLKSLNELILQTSKISEIIEILVIDNNSNDNTLEVVRSLKKKFPKLFISYYLENNQGLSYARNSAIQESKGDFIAFIDDDAVIGKSWLKSLLYGINNIKAEVFGGPIYPNFEINCPNWIDSNYFKRFFKKNDGYLSGLSSMIGFSGGNVCFKKNIFDSVGNFNVKLGMIGNKMGLGEETDLFIRLYKSSIEIKLYNLKKMAIIHFEGEYKLKKKYLKQRITLSGVQFVNRVLYFNKKKGIILIILKFFKQILLLFIFFICSVLSQKAYFNYLRSCWIIKGLSNGIIKSFND